MQIYIWDVETYRNKLENKQFWISKTKNIDAFINKQV